MMTYSASSHPTPLEKARFSWLHWERAYEASPRRRNSDPDPVITFGIHSGFLKLSTRNEIRLSPGNKHPASVWPSREQTFAGQTAGFSAVPYDKACRGVVALIRPALRTSPFPGLE